MENLQMFALSYIKMWKCCITSCADNFWSYCVAVSRILLFRSSIMQNLIAELSICG